MVTPSRIRMKNTTNLVSGKMIMDDFWWEVEGKSGGWENGQKVRRTGGWENGQKVRRKILRIAIRQLKNELGVR